MIKCIQIVNRLAYTVPVPFVNAHLVASFKLLKNGLERHRGVWSFCRAVRGNPRIIAIEPQFYIDTQTSSCLSGGEAEKVSARNGSSEDSRFIALPTFKRSMS